MATGVGFSFDTSFLQNLEKADKKMEALMDKSNSLSASVVSAFSKMSKNGVLPYIESLESKIRTLNSIKFSIGENASSDMKKLKEETSNVIDVINKLLTTLKQRPEYYNEVGRGQAQKVIDEYNRELEATRNYTRQRIQMYSDMFDEIDRRENEKRQQNQQVRDNAVQARANYEATIRMYEQMWREIDAKEKEKERRYLETQKREEEAAARKAKSVIDQANRELEAYRNAYKQRQQMYEQMWREIERRESSNRRGDYQNAMLGGTGGIKSADNALRYTERIYSDRGLLSVNNMQKAILQMQQAQNRLNLNTEEGKKKYEQLSQRIKTIQNDINKATGASEEFNKKQKGILDTSGQLARAFAAVFSVSAIKGYVNKLMQIRGEFELQQRSLQVLLQNKDEANALWDKTVALAVKSPYTTKQLVTATKQLAAYRIESEKLYETNKMLADVSIGLGVDMNRLILAFGQVKAANFLRGTELRQFSEAGVNMLDELAKRFTMLEGRAVSVGEVFERVSKRMVSFKDVEAVFKTITSEGGTFYQMQEKQSETLKGMMLNLKDSYELMLNDIGKSNESTLKGFVSFMRVFVDGWREAAVVIKTAGTAMLFYFAASKIAKIGSAFSGLWAAMAANPVGAIAAGVGVLIGLFVSLYQHTNKLNEALLEVEKNVGESLEESIGLYRKLTDTINDSTKSLDERNEAYEELKTKFKDILPDQQLELEYIQGLKFSYKEAEEAMFAYYNAKAIQQKKDKIESIYEGDFDRDTKDIITKYKDIIENTKKLNEEQKVLLKSGIGGAVFKTLEKLKKGEINIGDAYGAADDAAMAVENSIEDFLKDYSGIEINIINGIITKNAKQLARTAKKYTDAMLDVEGLSFQTAAQREAYEAMQEQNKEMEKAVSLYKHLVSLRQKLADNKVDLTSDESTLNEKQLQDREWYLNDLDNTMAEIAKLSPDVAKGIQDIDKSLVNAAQKGSYEFAKSLGVAENALYNIFADKAKMLKGGNEGASAMLTNFAEGIKANAESKLATPLQQAIIEAFDFAIKERDIDQKGKDLLAKLLPDSKQTTEDVRKSVEALLKQYQDEVKKWENATSAGATKLPFVEYLNQFGNTEFKSAISQYLGSTEEFKNLEQKMIPVLEHIYKLLGGDPGKDKKGRSRDLVDERLRVIKEIYKAYKELNKTFDETTSKTGALEKFGDAFYSAFGKTPEQMGYNLFTAEGVVDAYNKFISTLSKADDITKGNLAKGEFVMELQVEMQQKNDKAFQDQIEQMFSGYELSLELEQLNIPRDVAERLFGVDTFDLSEIREKIEKELYNLQIAGGGQDQINALQAYLKKVADMERKAQEDRLKKYVAFARGAISERAKVKLEEMNTIAEIEKTFEHKETDTEEQKTAKTKYKGLAMEQARKEANDALQKLDWEAFKSSDTFNTIFDDLENAGEKSLQLVIDKLKDFKEQWKDMPFDQMRQVVDLLQKAEEAQKVESNPFKEGKRLKKAIKEDGRSKEQALLDLSMDENLIKISEDDLSRYETYAQIQDGILSATTLTADEQKEYEEWSAKSVDAQRMLVESAKLQRQESEKGVGNAKKQLTNIDKLTDAYKEQETALNEINKLSQDLYKSFRDLAENGAALFGEELDETTMIFADMGASMADTVMQTVALWINLKSVETGAYAAGTALNSAMGVIGWIVMAVQLLSQVLKAVVQAHDNKRQKQIEAEAKNVERLQKAYEGLKETIDTTYDLSTLQQTADIANKNIEEQIAAQERMIALEEEKKKTDQSAIDGHNKEIEELKKQQKELKEQVLEEKGGFGSDENRKSAAEAFVDAWLQAYKETGDGLSGLNDQFNEFYESFVKKQLLLQGSSKYLNAFFDQFDEQIASITQSGATKEQIAHVANAIKDTWDGTSSNLDAFLSSLAEALKVSEMLGTTELAGLQAGISGITEDQADVLASYMNSIRFFVADSNTQLKALVAAQGIDTDIPNPMLSQLMNIAESVRQNAATTDAINDLLNRVKLSTNDGTALKVRMV